MASGRPNPFITDNWIFYMDPKKRSHYQEPEEAYRPMGSSFSNGLENFREFVRKKPMVVLGVAFGIGLLIGLMTTRSKKQDDPQK